MLGHTNIGTQILVVERDRDLKKQCAKKYCCVIKHVKHVGQTDIWQQIHQQTSSTYNTSNKPVKMLIWKYPKLSFKKNYAKYLEKTVLLVHR